MMYAVKQSKQLSLAPEDFCFCIRIILEFRFFPQFVVCHFSFTDQWKVSLAPAPDATAVDLPGHPPATAS